MVVAYNYIQTVDRRGTHVLLAVRMNDYCMMEIFFIFVAPLLTSTLCWRGSKSGVIFAFVKFVFLEPFLLIIISSSMCVCCSTMYFVVYFICVREHSLIDPWLTSFSYAAAPLSFFHSNFHSACFPNSLSSIKGPFAMWSEGCCMFLCSPHMRGCIHRQRCVEIAWFESAAWTAKKL